MWIWTYIVSSVTCKRVLVYFLCVRSKVDFSYISFSSFLRRFVLSKCFDTDICSSIIFLCLFPLFSPWFTITTLCSCHRTLLYRTTFHIVINHNIVLSQSFFIGGDTEIAGWQRKKKEKGNSKRKTRRRTGRVEREREKKRETEKDNLFNRKAWDIPYQV